MWKTSGVVSKELVTIRKFTEINREHEGEQISMNTDVNCEPRRNCSLFFKMFCIISWFKRKMSNDIDN